MGKVVMDTNQIITNNIKKINESSVSEYSRFIEGRPFFTTYMNQNVINSTYDKGTQNIERIGSGNSAVKFNVIKELPIFNIDSLSLNTDYDDIGITSNIEGEGIIPPDTIKPLPNDLFIIDVISDKIIFKVTKVDVDSIRNKPFYKISFKFSKKLKDTESYTSFLNGAITDEYDFIYDNILQEEIVETEKMGRRKLSYDIQNFRDGYLVTQRLELPADKVVDFKRQLKLNENILRTMFLEVSKVKA
jgi:ribosomal protein S6